VTGRWTGRGLCLTGRVQSVFSVCACLSFLIGCAARPVVDESLLDSNRMLALYLPVNSPARLVADSLERCSGLTSVSGPLQD
jgi:hypothetical protein